MKLKIGGVLIAFAIGCSSAFGDSYATFKTTRFYSQNRRFFVEVRENKRAVLYRNSRRLRKLWQRDLPDLPRELMVANDGSAIAIVDFYYGNNCRPDAPVVMLFGPGGKELSRYLLRDVADRSRTIATTSMCYWYGDVKFAPDGQSLIVQTIVAKHDRSECRNPNSTREEAEKWWKICMATSPYQNLIFDMANGSLVSREKVAVN